MKRTNTIALGAVILSTLLLSNANAVEQRGKIDPITPKSIRLPGETKRDMVARIFGSGLESHLSKKQASKKLHKMLAQKLNSGSKTSLQQPIHSCKCCKEHKKCRNFKNFKGFWLLDSMAEQDSITVIEFFTDKCGNTFARLFDGTQNYIRERNQNDADFEFTFPADDVVFPVQVLSANSLRLVMVVPLGEDDRRYTFRIQDADPNVGYVMFRSDSPEVAITEIEGGLVRYIRLPERPDIQLNRLPSKIDWTNPVEMFKYIVDYYAQLGQPQKAVSLNQTDYIGWANYEQLAQTMLTTGIKRTAKVSTTYRGGGYIGVWRTQFPDDFPATTIHTQEVHHFNVASKIEISGFTGAYSVLNGTHLASAGGRFSRNFSPPFPWQDCSSREPFVYIVFDSSQIEEAYDPNIHGVATLVAQHGPITPDINYREFMAAVFDFGYSSFGFSTHSAIATWRDTGVTTPETFEQLKEGLATDSLGFTNTGFRDFRSNGLELYWNPFILGGVSFFNRNDPFGLGFAEFDPYFDYDITIENYLDKSTIKNIFFTITGPVLPEQPITGLLVDSGYPSNGSQVVFKANDFQTFPAPLVDQFGTHPYMILAGGDNSPESVNAASQAFFGGIVNDNFSNGKKVAYIRIFDESGFNGSFTDVLTRYPLVFGRNDIPNKYTNNYVAAWASLLEELNKHNPDRYVLDIRQNGGGYLITSALASLFGGNRPSPDNAAEAYPGNGQRAPLPLVGSGIQTVFDSVPKTPYIIPNDIVAQVFPLSAVRSDDREIEVIVLTSTRSASSGDVFPHNYLGPDPESTIQDLGHNVKARIVGDIDGRLWSESKGIDPLPIDSLSPNLVDSAGTPRTATYLSAEAGLLYIDRHGYFVNSTLSTRPNPLLKGWYDQTEWQDLGKTPVIQAYPLGDAKPLPVFEDRSTWRDVWLENAIVD